MILFRLFLPEVETEKVLSSRLRVRTAMISLLAVMLVCPLGMAQTAVVATQGTPSDRLPPADAPATAAGHQTPVPDDGTSAAPAPSRGLAPPPIGGGPWVAQGPGPAINGQVENVSPNNEVSGAIHTVAAHPSDPDILWAGAANGGVWKTTNATSATPSWSPLTDGETSLSIGALDFDPLDPSQDTLVAGIGRYSAFAQFGGVRSGLMRTTDGGALWTALPTMTGRNISGVAARGQTIVVSVNTADIFTCGSGGNIGIWRSTDGGATFTVVTAGVPASVAFDLASDRAASTVLYTGVTYGPSCSGLPNGIYKSGDTGVTWVKVSNAAMDALIVDGVTNNIEIAADGLDVFVDIIQSGQPVGIFHSANGGSTWAAMDLPRTPEGSPAGIGLLTPGAPIVIDTSPTPHGLSTGMEVEITGVGGTVGANGVWRITVTSSTKFWLDNSSDFTPWTPGTGNWVKVAGLSPRVKPGAQGAIHASIRTDPTIPSTVFVGGDRQDMPFPNFLGALDYSGRLFRGDGTIAPTGAIPSPQWDHITHSNAVAAIPNGGTAGSSAPHADSREMVFDANGDLIEVDDGGIYRLTNPASNTGDWFSINGNIQVTEIHDVAYDAVSRIIISGNQDTGTTQQQSAGSLTWDSVHTADGGDVAVDDTSIVGISTRYSSFQNLTTFRRREYDATNVLQSEIFPTLNVQSGVPLLTSFLTPVELNANMQTRLVIGGCNAVYESWDQGDNLDQITGLLDSGCAFGGLFPLPQNAIAYGGRSGGMDIDDVLYVGSLTDVYLRSAPFPTPLSQLAAYPGTATIRDVVIDTNEWRNAFVVDTTQVYWTPDAGTTWTNISGNLTDPGFESAAFIPGSPDALVVGGRDGVFQLTLPPVSPYVWGELGTGLPNAPVWDLEYDTNVGTLTAGTMGRGAWILFVRYLLSVSKLGTGSGTVSSSPPGINCGPVCNALFPTGTGVSLLQTAFAGSTFTGWGGDADCSDGHVTMSNDVNCTAIFELDTMIIFVDGFESGDHSAWSGSMGG